MRILHGGSSRAIRQCSGYEGDNRRWKMGMHMRKIQRKGAKKVERRDTENAEKFLTQKHQDLKHRKSKTLPLIIEQKFNQSQCESVRVFKPFALLFYDRFSLSSKSHNDLSFLDL